MARFEVGDIVKIVNNGKIYTTYPSFFEEQNCSGLMAGYTYGALPKSKECQMTLFCVLAVGKHHDMDRTICIINNGIHTYMIGENGLDRAKIVLEEEKDEEIKVGDKVVITDVGHVYSCYEDFILNYRKELPTEEFWNWKYGFSPSGPDFANYKVLAIHKHLERPNEGLLAIIANSSNTFIVAVHSLRKV